MTATTALLSRLTMLATLSLSSWGSDFSFFTTMRAGFPGATWELGAGSTAATTESQSNYQWSSSSTHWRPTDLPQNFQIGYRRSTGAGFVTVFDSTNTPFTASFTNPGAALNASAIWTLPALSFFATATSFLGPSSINIANLTFSPGVQILSGSLPASIGASYSGTGPAIMTTAAAPIVFNPASAGGDWTIAGTIRFNGVFPVSGFALGDQLRFGFGASGTDNPETSTAFLIGGGLIALGCIRQRRQARNALKAAQPT